MEKTQKVIIQITLAVAVVVLQVLSMRLRYSYEQHYKNFEVGLESVGNALLMESFGLLSGFALAWLPGKTLQNDEHRRGVNIGLILLLIFTLLLVVIKVLMLGSLWSMELFVTLMPDYKPFGKWVFLSQVPSLLAGFSLGKLLLQPSKKGV